MRISRSPSVTLLAVLVAAGSLVASGRGQDKQTPQLQMPQAGVPQIMTIQGNFIRAAYNNEGYAILGYQLANRSIGQPLMLLEVGLTLRDGVKNYTLKRDAVSLETPDGKTIPMVSPEEYRSVEGAAQGLQNRSKVQRDSINYFPPSASQACRLGFFADLGEPAKMWDQVELSSMRGCVGRVYFQIPGGITYGQHWLNVKFAESTVRVPFRILTEDEEKHLSKNFKSIKKQVDEAFKPKKKK